MVFAFPFCTIFLMVPSGQADRAEKRTEIERCRPMSPKAAGIVRASLFAWGAGA